MYLKRITKPNRNGDKIYEYYRLVHSYKIGNKIRQQTIINLGKLEELPKENHKLLADRIEAMLTGTEAILFNIPDQVETLAAKFTKKNNWKRYFFYKEKSETDFKGTLN